MKYKSNNKIDSWFPIKTTEVFDAYWYFAAERQEIFFKKFHNQIHPGLLMKYCLHINLQMHIEQQIE